MLPYCSENDVSATWMCFRGVILGLLSLWTAVLCVYAISIMLPASIRLPQFRPSVALVVLAALEMTCILFRCLWVNEPKLMIFAKYCRGLQVSISCWLYGRLACDITGKKSLVYGLLLPLLVGVAMLMTVDVLVMLDDPIVDCHHTSWLIMSLASATLAVSFASAGLVVLKELKSAAVVQRHTFQSFVSHHKELDKTYQQLWMLVLTNMVSSLLQLSYDLYIAYFVGDQPCSQIFYDDKDGTLEQVIRLLFAFASFVYPEWITIYVFFWSQRHQFSTHLDVPDFDDSLDIQDEQDNCTGVTASSGSSLYHKLLDHPGPNHESIDNR
ncbi:Aste57867_1315 [Aphanomyces stellatus]|uniref:Aste57867_1315 protein n=1 Tax=Aphanomyces stellatus TaxID=120398 RepID=A0A485K946_9STRA|nr:hypothetical protein As57867_001314 [Aphanomyces stellatus]VFT78534.1 Aste57867_1315 [Aphanomyces stellatus]